MTREERLARIVEQEQQLAERAARSLRVFVELFWPELEPNTPFIPNWHIDLICDYLEAVSRGQYTRLVINLPPRYMKSIIVSVMFACWEWVRDPSRRYLCVSHAEALALRHAIDRRRVLESDLYRRLYPHVRLARDQQQKAECHNSRRGMMVACSMGGAVTGKGGSRIILDDPHNPTQAESDVQRQQAVEYFTGTLSTRLDDKARDAIVVVMQRLHTQDISGVCLALGYTHLCLPALEPIRRVISFPSSKSTIVREPDMPLWPARENAAQLAEQRQVLGSYAFAGQYLQTPVPLTGGLFPPGLWRYYDRAPLQFDQVLQSWDLAFKGTAQSDYVVGLVAGRVGAQVYLLDRFKGKVGFTDTCRAIQDMMARYPTTTQVLVEDAANGAAVVDMLTAHVSGLIAVTPEGGKASRAQAAQPLIEAGQVLLPTPRDPSSGRQIAGRDWVDDFVAISERRVRR
jgi:predicted phage terminase large subunit-like protein